ncbi:4591_t:CDS:10 [Paraglomus occultum]|uniref:DNA polymerase lambda n=1 Tax=Paraglomus occultum TaxID=144539 RepID=A0A9N9CM60_9GLOM|nr:4591_t:CDS:10 [Paraglomus occultum]
MFSENQYVFEKINIFLIETKIPHEKIKFLKNTISLKGGRIVANPSTADVILTTLKSPARISRYIGSETRKPVVSVEWVDKCVSKGTRLEFKDYLVMGIEDAMDWTTVKEKEEEEKELSDEDGNSLSSRSPIYTSENESSDDDRDVDLDPRFLNTSYECLRPTPLKSKFNVKLVELLEVIERARELNDQWRNALSYRRAIAVLKSYPRDIISQKEIKKIRGIGSKIGYQVKSYLRTGTIAEAEHIRQDKRLHTLELFASIYGVGPKTALSWYRKGYRTIEDCKNHPNLTKAQQLGLQLVDDLREKMSREDVEEIYTIIKENIKELDPKCIIQPVGGYRRGKDLNGDLDLLISHPDEERVSSLLNDIITRLTEGGYIKHLLYCARSESRTDSKHGIIDHLEKCFVTFLQPSTQIKRQVDMIVATQSQFASAMVGWTGSRQYERSLRRYAKREKKMVFTSHGLFTNTKPRKLISTSTEREIFDILGVPWLEPEMRNC